MNVNLNTNVSAQPWGKQLTQTGPEPWAAGVGILILTGFMCVWYASLVMRFTAGTDTSVAALWVAVMILWLVAQIWISRAHIPERYSFMFFTLVQAGGPVLATVVIAMSVPAFEAAVNSIALGVSVNELVAIHVLRLAAWGTIAKYLKGQFPRYFYLLGSLPDFGFAVFAALVTVWLVFLGGQASDTFLLVYSVAGAAAFIGAATSMHFGIPGSPLSWRWSRVERGEEAPTLLPHRWPMNLAPAFCGSAFWLAHGLLFVKLAA